MPASGPVLRWVGVRVSFTRIAPAKAMPARRAAAQPSAPAARRAEGDDCSRLTAESPALYRDNWRSSWSCCSHLDEPFRPRAREGSKSGDISKP